MRIIDTSETEFLRKIQNEDLQIVGFGTGKLAQEALENKTIRNRLCYFVDNDHSKQNNKFVFHGIGYDVFGPQILSNTSLEDSVLLLCSTYFKEIAVQLNQIPELADAECYIFPIIRLNFANREEQFEKRVLKPALKEFSRVLGNSGLTKSEQKGKLEEKRKLILGDGLEERPLVLPRIMIMPTTVCNLRCKNCSSLFPYFDKPGHLDINEVISDLNAFFSVVDECIRITIGGEPFLYPSLEKLLSYLISQPKLSGILMITNSTIIPKKPILDLITDNKVEVLISDYGYIDKMSRIVSLFEANGVCFSVLSDQEWVDMGNTNFRNKDDRTRRLEYLNCEQSLLMKAIYSGKMFSCARGARMYALGVYTSESDYFDLSSSSLKEKIIGLLHKEIADSCNHCDCGKFPSKIIPAGIQINDSKKVCSDYTGLVLTSPTIVF